MVGIVPVLNRKPAGLLPNDPTPPPAVKAEAVAAAGGIDGATIFGQKCSGCHGGDGSGGIGPRLAGGRVVAEIADAQEQIAFVTNGRGGMPKFGERLSPVVDAGLDAYVATIVGHLRADRAAAASGPGS